MEWNRNFRTYKIDTSKCLAEKTRLSFTVGVRCVLPEGRYLVVPCTKKQGVRREFIVRVFTSRPNKAKYAP